MSGTEPHPEHRTHDPDRLPVEARRHALHGEPAPPLGWQAPLLDLVAAVLRRWQLFLIVFTLGMVVGVGRYLTTRPYFRSACVARLMQREKPILDVQITHGSLETGRDVAARGETGALMLPAEVDLYTQLLRSDAVMTSVGERFATRLGLPDAVHGVELVYAMRDKMRVSGTEEGLITVEATAPDAQVASDLANALVDEMIEAGRRAERQLILEQIGYLSEVLVVQRTRLAARERDLEEFVARHGIVDLAKQTSDILSLLRDTEYARQGFVRERLARLEAFTEDDHVARRLQRQIEQCDADLRDLRARAHGQKGLDGGDGVRQIDLELEALRAEATRQRDLVAMLQSELDVFEFELDQPKGAVSVVTRAMPVRKRAGPGKGDTVGVSLLVAFVLGVALALLREQLEKVDRDPYLARRADEIRAHARMLAPEWLANRIAPPRAPPPPARRPPTPVGGAR